MKNRVILMLVVGLLSLALDQGTKHWAKSSLRQKPAVTVLKGYLALEYHENAGMAFGLGRNLPGARFVLTGLGIAVLFFVWRMVRQVQKRRTLADVAFGLVAGGAIGNIVDRIIIGRVVDFIVMHWQRKFVWPAYNVADAALVVGVALLLLAMSGQRAQASAGGDKSSGGGRSKGRKR